ncbi:SDR family oxidoreductase [Bacillus sp. V3B]|uniref:SDR family oxidoreductase n=1 Tax=Bacillus sp. V3B TaxID=2804915 RepID=UPI00210DA926|nr:SDR family oxidoreductase [Bacillus sp. V3B]MCQ6277549.1 SDR family oxidoreductase [Bacillus sp. V3B]
MSKKVALITGANRGLGFEIGRQLGRQGITVLLAARSLVKAEASAALLREEQIDARALELDVTDSKHINLITELIEKEYGKLDILVNNAGVNLNDLGNTTDVMRNTFEVNVFGVHALTEALLPLLKASEAGRIVNQSSLIGSISTVLSNEETGRMTYNPIYAASKATLNMLTASLSVRLKGTNIKVNSAHPGWVKTDLGGNDAPVEVHEGAETAVYLATLPDDGPTGGFFRKNEILPW